MTREEYRAASKARGLTDCQLAERLETGARALALDTTAGRAYVLETHRRASARRSSPEFSTASTANRGFSTREKGER